MRLQGVRRAACVLAAAVATGCATFAPLAPSSDDAAAVAAGAPFDVAGRLTARRGSEGIAAHFTWTHVSGGDRIDIATPLGQTVARLSGDAGGVRVERPGEPEVFYADWNTVTRNVLGVGIPVEGLSAWIVGKPAANTAFALERDALGRASVLRQQGWEIVYAYADDVAASALPARLVLRFPDSEPIDVRIVVDRWATKP